MVITLSLKLGDAAGGLGGAAVAAAVRLSHQDEFAGKTIVVILPDGAERYMSTALFEGL